MTISRDKNLLFPEFRTRLDEFERLLAIEHLPFYLFMGLRSFKEQNDLYSQGRTKPGNIVTNARGGDSFHNYGLGADYVLDGQIEKPGIQWSWETKADLNADGRNDWMQMGELAERCGLKWGGRWKKFPDLPHVEFSGFTIQELKEMFRRCNGILSELWNMFKR